MKIFVYSILIFLFMLAIIAGITNEINSRKYQNKMWTLYNKSEKNIIYKNICKDNFFKCNKSNLPIKACFKHFQRCMKESK